MEASTTDRQADVHILCIDEVVARASDMAASLRLQKKREEEEGQLYRVFMSTNWIYLLGEADNSLVDRVQQEIIVVRYRISITIFRFSMSRRRRRGEMREKRETSSSNRAAGWRLTSQNSKQHHHDEMYTHYARCDDGRSLYNRRLRYPFTLIYHQRRDRSVHEQEEDETS